MAIGAVLGLAVWQGMSRLEGGPRKTMNLCKPHQLHTRHKKAVFMQLAMLLLTLLLLLLLPVLSFPALIPQTEGIAESRPLGETEALSFDQCSRHAR